MKRFFLLAFCLLPLCAPCAPTNQPARVTSSLAVTTNGVVVAPVTNLYFPSQTLRINAATVTNLTIGVLSGVDAADIPTAGGTWSTNTVQAALQDLAADIAVAVGDVTEVQVSGGLLTASSGTGPVPVIGLTTDSVRNATAIYLPLTAGASKPLTSLLYLNGGNRVGFNSDNSVIPGSPDTNLFFSVESLAATPTATRSMMDLTTDGGTESGGFLFRAVNSSAVTNTLASLTTAGLWSPYGFSGPGSGLTGVNAATLGGTAGSAFLLKAGGTMSGTLNMGDGIITNVNRLVFNAVGGAGVPYLSVSGTDTLMFTHPGSWTQTVYTSSNALIPVADLAQSGASLNQVPVWNGSEWAPGTVTSGIGGATGSLDNAILRANGLGGSTMQSSDLSVTDAATATANNVRILNEHAGQTNSSLGLTPKGSGALFAGPAPDGLATGGNPRGAHAVDWQVARTAADQVASGHHSAILGGYRNKASNLYDSVIGGDRCEATGGYGSIAGGYVSKAQNTSTVALGNAAIAAHAHSAALGFDSAGGPTTDRANQFKIRSGSVTLQTATGALSLWGKQSTAPTTGVLAGDLYYDTGTNKWRAYDGAAWNDLW